MSLGDDESRDVERKMRQQLGGEVERTLVFFSRVCCPWALLRCVCCGSSIVAGCKLFRRGECCSGVCCCRGWLARSVFVFLIALRRCCAMWMLLLLLMGYRGGGGAKVPAMKQERTHEVEEVMDIGSGKEVAVAEVEVGQWVYMCACMGSIDVSACALAPVVIVLLSFQVPAVLAWHLDASADKKQAWVQGQVECFSA